MKREKILHTSMDIIDSLEICRAVRNRHLAQYNISEDHSLQMIPVIHLSAYSFDEQKNIFVIETFELKNMKRVL